MQSNLDVYHDNNNYVRINGITRIMVVFRVKWPVM